MRHARVFYAPEGDSGAEVLWIEIPGPKRFFRVWLNVRGDAHAPVTDWGWRVREDAVELTHGIYTTKEAPGELDTYEDGESSGYADWVIAFQNTNIEFPDRVNRWSPTEIAQWLEAEMMRNR